MYAIPSIVAENKTSITISKDKSYMWYDEYRIDEKSFNDNYHNMKIENCIVLKDNENIEQIR